MSDIGDTTDLSDTVVEDVIPEGDAPIDDGQADGAGETQEVDDFSIDAYLDREVAVKIDGEEVKVPLKEALSGYQRQADYTRKTQQLSKAQAMMEALEANPEATLQFLASQYGGRTAPQAAQPAEPAFDPDDPVAAELYYVKQQLAELTTYQTSQVLDQTISGLKAKYGDDFNEQEVIRAAAQRQVTHPSELEGVFRDLMFDKFYATAKAREEAAAGSAAEKAAREAAKAALQGQVTGGNGVPGQSTVATPPVINSVEDAWEAAKAAAGISF